jgi:UDP-N-acetylmuramoyl-tripeptide--D-alanyl-D-alanine ligase
MKPMLLSQAARAVQGRMTGPDTGFEGAGIDSRSIGKGQLFVAIKGPRFDGHDFLKQAEKAGAAAAMIAEDCGYDGKMPVIRVGDTLEGLQRLAGYYRDLFNLKMAAITGSNGKTSTKEMLAAVLGARYRVLKNTGNLNNQYGIPLSLFQLETDHQAAVMELGMSGFGEIAVLARLVKPQVGVITNAGEGHTEFLKNAENVAKAKTELLQMLPAEGRAVINFDDRLLKSHISESQAPVVGFSLEQGSDYRPGDVKVNELGISFTLNGTGFSLPVLGIHNVYNALAAVAAGEAMGVGLKEAAEALRGFKPAAMRLEVMDLGKFKLLNDAYNANPQSMKAALEVLGSLRASRKVAILGDMKELGEISPARHFQSGELAGSKADLVVAAGPNARDIFEGAKRSGADARHFGTTEDLVHSLPELVTAGDLILVKASRSMHFELVVEALRRI